MSLSGGKLLPKCATGKLKAVCIVVPSMFVAAAPVGAKSNAIYLSMYFHRTKF